MNSNNISSSVRSNLKRVYVRLCAIRPCSVLSYTAVSGAIEAVVGEVPIHLSIWNGFQMCDEERSSRSR